MTARSKNYVKRQREEGVVVYKAMIPEHRKEELKQLVAEWREEHKRNRNVSDT